MRRQSLPTALPTVLVVCAVVGLLLGFAVAVRAMTSPSDPSAGSLVADTAAASSAVATGAPVVSDPASASASATGADSASTPTVSAGSAILVGTPPSTPPPPTAAPTTAAPTAPAAKTTPPMTTAAAPQGGGGRACRAGSTRVGLQLAMSGTVCGRLNGDRWEGTADLTLTSLGGTVDGTAYLFFNNVPEEPSFDLTNTPVHVPAGRSVTVRTSVSAAVTDSQTGGFITARVQGAWPSGSGTGDTGSLTSPIVWKTRPPATPSTSTAVGSPVCAKGRITFTGVSASYSYCSKQSGGRLIGSGTITYSTTDPATSVALTMGQAVNTDQNLWPGQTAFAPGLSETTVLLPGSTRKVTVALPPMDVQLVSSDRTARAYTFKDTQPDLSPILTLR